MARFYQNFRNTRLSDQVVQSTTYPGLITQVNTALAALVNPTIRSFTFINSDPSKRLGSPFYVFLDYEDGGAALATPFQLQVIQASTIAGLQTAVQAYYNANPALFISGARPQVWDMDDTRVQTFYSAYLTNVTAGATNNIALK